MDRRELPESWMRRATACMGTRSALYAGADSGWRRSGRPESNAGGISCALYSCGWPGATEEAFKKDPQTALTALGEG